MTFSMYSSSVPVFRQVLTALSAVLDKAEAHAVAKKIEPAALLQARLFPDMFPLARQVQVAADFAKGACARLAGVDVPKYDDVENTFPELRARIAKTMAFIGSLSQDDIAASATRAITTGSGEKTRQPDRGTAMTVAAASHRIVFLDRDSLIATATPPAINAAPIGTVVPPEIKPATMSTTPIRVWNMPACLLP